MAVGTNVKIPGGEEGSIVSSWGIVDEKKAKIRRKKRRVST
jgi:hypothetical protein